MTRSFRISFTRILAVGVALGLLEAACAKKATEVAAPALLTLVQGGNQAVQAGKELPNAVVVRVLGADGKPATKVTVGFVVATGGGSVTPGSAVSDDNGEVKTKWTLGPTQPEQLLQVVVAGMDPLKVTATGILPSDIIIAQGNNQTARISGALANAIVVRVVGFANTPMAGVPVLFQITAGGGVITPQSGLTNGLGEVTARWTLGAQAGSNVLVVSALSLQSAIVTATATP
jgi:hypothetical protein